MVIQRASFVFFPFPGPYLCQPSSLPQISSTSPQHLRRGSPIYLLTVAVPEDKEPLFILLAVTEGDKAILGVFKVDADPCEEEHILCGEKKKGKCVTGTCVFLTPPPTDQSKTSYQH